MRLRIADLRKKSKITQKELADAIGISFQTISRWENDLSMPDITILPILADYFNVTVDQLLGLKPLTDDKYIYEDTGKSQFWNSKLDYLLKTRKNYWNNDYIEFLIKKVWRLEKPVSILDCGCGYGFMGLLLMPYMPSGSRYTGIDFAAELVEQGKKIFEKYGISGTFLAEDNEDSAFNI